MSEYNADRETERAKTVRLKALREARRGSRKVATRTPIVWLSWSRAMLFQGVPPGGDEMQLVHGVPNHAVLGRRSQKIGVDMAKRTKRREWTKDDIRELKSLARQKTPVAKIAKSIKRTLRATQQKAYSIGVSLKRG
jgi:hypothetical protein